MSLLSSQIGSTPEQGLPVCMLHIPPEHVSVPLQNIMSLHAAVLFVYEQPVAGTHPLSVHGFMSSQVTGVLTHEPDMQRSIVVHMLVSVQLFVSSFVNTQLPFAGLQLSSVQALVSSQTTGFDPTQTPAEQASVWVQAFPSEQVFVSSFV